MITVTTDTITGEKIAIAKNEELIPGRSEGWKGTSSYRVKSFGLAVDCRLSDDTIYNIAKSDCW